ncbi:LOW QUALITY PROTEIN: protein PLANT CADMIUM RESISTANCE 3 [Vigna angularis]|uniref:LOW QUALITY PROTEIN: protein PLANT CADMIUM RESISTANCE 3 n=1 Tax=Phaseolus angularis TaxID=3914 RepID=UPI0022B4DDD5|nr:LOW QUALITY PROTEIN: protein PLANT CADMIUM RESISTANCE 3 [Vigna angularis]
MSGSWSTGLCDCFSDCDSCCLTYCCPCVSFGRVAEILDKGEISCCLHGSLFYLLAGFTVVGGCIYACLYREKLREMYGIEGDNCTDCLVSSFCLHLSLCQNYRELKARGFDISAGWEGNVEMHTRSVTSAPGVQGGMNR